MNCRRRAAAQAAGMPLPAYPLALVPFRGSPLKTQVAGAIRKRGRLCCHASGATFEGQWLSVGKDYLREGGKMSECLVGVPLESSRCLGWTETRPPRF